MNESFNGGEAAALIAQGNWANSALGAVDAWPQSLRTAVDIVIHSPMPMLLLWGEGLTQLYNDSFSKLVGAQHPQAFGQPMRYTWPEHDTFTAPIIRAVLLGEVCTYNDQCFTLERQGQQVEVWLDLTYSPIPNEQRKIGGVLVTAIETDERRRITQELQQRTEASSRAYQESEERLQLALATTSTLGIWDWDIDEDRFVADNNFARMHGLDPLTAGKHLISDYLRGIHPDDRGLVARSVRNCLLDNAEYSEEYRLLQTGGQVRWMFARGRGLGVDDRPRRFIGAALDITERKQAEHALRQSQTELQLIINAMPVLIGYVDHEECYRLNNSAYMDWFGNTPQELYGKTLREVHGEALYAEAKERISAALAGQACNFEHTTLDRKGRMRYARTQYLPRYSLDGSANGFYIFVSDETERRKNEEALRQLNETLEQRVSERTQALAEANQRLQQEMAEREHAEEALRHAQKMEAVGQLTGGIAHDFNNMLTGIIGSLDLMKRYIAAGRSAEIGRFADAAVSSAQRAAALTHRLLAFSRRQSLDRQAIDTNQLVRSLEELLGRTKGAHIELQVELQEALWSVKTDAGQLESALVNLVINARDAMPDGGVLKIETANRYLDSSDTTALEPVKPGDYVMLSVSDNGTGMTPLILAKAFDPFFTTKPIGQGTGLGLSMIYGFAQQSGGHVTIQSKPGQGTCVRLFLPRHHATGEPVPAVLAALEVPYALAGECVLVVEDDPAVRMLVLNVLDELGYTAHPAADARTALPLLESSLRVDLLVTDVGLPGMNGRQLAEIAREQRPDLKVLFMTGYCEMAAERQGFLAEGMDMIAKPFSIDLLANKIREMINHGIAAS